MTPVRWLVLLSALLLTAFWVITSRLTEDDPLSTPVPVALSVLLWLPSAAGAWLAGPRERGTRVVVLLSALPLLLLAGFASAYRPEALLVLAAVLVNLTASLHGRRGVTSV